MDDLLDQPMPAHAGADIEDRPPGRRQHRADLGRGLVECTDQGRRIIGLRIELESADRRSNRRTNTVAGDLQVAGPLPLHHRAKTRSIVAGADSGSSRIAASTVTSR